MFFFLFFFFRPAQVSPDMFEDFFFFTFELVGRTQFTLSPSFYIFFLLLFVNDFCTFSFSFPLEFFFTQAQFLPCSFLCFTPGASLSGFDFVALHKKILTFFNTELNLIRFIFFVDRFFFLILFHVSPVFSACRDAHFSVCRCDFTTMTETAESPPPPVKPEKNTAWTK